MFAIPVKWLFKPTLHNYEVVWGLKVGEEIEGVKKATEFALEPRKIVCREPLLLRALVRVD